ncbi:CCT motif-containing protein [Phytophthora infestans]|uniref:CCT motif-containing protein n=1 Tax=Phytophthora infestans TaxID=4787 RepID=A0A833SKD1_PHYIN|nr:CCT motif-containing protein [Phytophthora infestans]
MSFSKSNLPPTLPVAIKKEREDPSSLSGSMSIPGSSSSIPRKDSIGWGADDFLGMISHTPPAFSPGSLTMPMTKRGRSGSISSRLLSASDLEERGYIDRYQKGVLKDLIISGDEALQKALEKFDAGDPTTLEAMLDSGALNRKSSSIDLLDDLDLGFLNVGSLGDTPKDEFQSGGRNQSLDEWDELGFDSSFADVSARDILDGEFYSSSLGASLPNSLPSMGLGITPPAGFSFAEDFLENQVKTEPGIKSEGKNDTGSKTSTGATGASTSSSAASSLSTSRPIGIPGSAGAARPFMGVDKGKDGQKQNFVGAYSPDSRRKRIEKFLDKRQKRVWRKEVKYDVRKNFADSRLRVKGRFVKKEDEQLLRELLSFT